ncbi:qcr9 subunit 9 of the ubiquinol cytochrome-c reductase complex [Malassezia furfur]|uniref:Complex III subunit 9 n=1 Tax=Malassezia furfur TaxID=55194 RepID=A0ABY8EP95_MALFU|nr:qcr9 subunit 9 of the ubiquinol cytochrome-c reductase complex [Malassezia furfur]
MSLANTLYNTVGTIFTGAFLFGIGFDTATQMWWDRHNKGKQWADIRDKCIKMADGGDDDE